MQKILEQLYTGNLYPYSKFRTTIEQFRESRDKAYQLYTSFSEKLPEELREEFNELIDSQLDLLPFELEQNFIEGFCIGTRMMAEVYSAPINEDCGRKKQEWP